MCSWDSFVFCCSFLWRMKWYYKVDGEATEVTKQCHSLAEHGSPSKLLKLLTVKLFIQQTVIFLLLPSTSLDTNKVAMFH